MLLYPEEFVKPWVLDSTELTIRPIRPEDEPMMARFHATLSERSVYLRYFHMMPLDRRIAHDREKALVAERSDPATGESEILAVGRLSRSAEANEAEFGVVINDRFQGHGLGTELVKRLIEIARSEGVERVTADILGENRQMIEICRLLGFRLRHSISEGVVKAELEIS